MHAVDDLPNIGYTMCDVILPEKTNVSNRQRSEKQLLMENNNVWPF